MHSWRVLILPETETQLRPSVEKPGWQSPVSVPSAIKQYDFDEPWDSPNNSRLEGAFLNPSQLRDKILPRYACPADKPRRPFATSYLALTGPGTAFDVNKKTTLEDLPNDLIIVVEVADSNVHWMEPRDLNINEIAHGINKGGGLGISSHHPRGAFVLFADQQVWFLDQRVPFQDLKKFLTIEGAKNYDRDKILEPYHIDW